MRVLLLVGLALLGLAGAEEAELRARLDKQGGQIAQLIAGVVNLKNKIQNRKDGAAAGVQKMHYFMDRLDRSKGGNCHKGEMNCGSGNVGDCVPNAICCDGVEDCSNGADESSMCDFSPAVGQKYSGRFEFYNCVMEYITDVDFTVTEFKKREYAPAFADIHGIVSWKDESNPQVVLDEQLIYDGIYTYGSKLADFRINYHGQVYHEHMYFPEGHDGPIVYEVFEAGTNSLCGKAYMHPEHH